MDITTIAKSDIFFLIASISTIVISLLFAAVLVLLIRVLRTIQKVSTTALKESENIVSDLQNIRISVNEKVKAISSLVTLGSALGVIKKVKAKVNKAKK